MNAPVSRLDAELVSEVLAFLGVSGGRKPDLALLDEYSGGVYAACTVGKRVAHREES